MLTLATLTASRGSARRAKWESQLAATRTRRNMNAVVSTTFMRCATLCSGMLLVALVVSRVYL